MVSTVQATTFYTGIPGSPIAPGAAGGLVVSDTNNHLPAANVAGTDTSLAEFTPAGPPNPTPRQFASASADEINVISDGINASNSDNGQALNNLAAWCATNGKGLYFPPLPAGQSYKYTPPWVIPGNLRVRGDFCAENWGSFVDTFESINYPTRNPPLVGSVLGPLSNGEDAIQITGSGAVVTLRGFGILFQTPFGSSGHGINATAKATSQGFDNGLSGSRWEDIVVFGHDGNHYAYNLTNPIYDTLTHLRFYGGGGIKFENQNSVGNFGNSVIDHPRGELLCGGTAHGYNVVSTSSLMNALTFIRPQVNVEAYQGALMAPASAPTSAQHSFLCDAASVHIRIIAPDMESPINGVTAVFPSNNQLSGVDVYGNGCTVDAFSYSSAPNGFEFFPGGNNIQSGGLGVSAGALSGSATFPRPFSAPPVVMLCGWNISGELANAVTETGFEYTATGPGALYWLAFGASSLP